jgi:exonuclease 3'-5' domain-containing protein 1
MNRDYSCRQDPCCEKSILQTSTDTLWRALFKVGFKRRTILDEDFLTPTATDRRTTASTDKSDVIEIIQELQETQPHQVPPSGLIDTPAAIALLVASLSDLPNHPPSLYFDLEGINLSRHGSISILQLHVLPTNKTYLVDMHTLKAEAFSTASPNGQTLQTILESANIQKAFFDIRNDSDALYSLYNISVAGIHDIQLMELATRPFSKRFIRGLARCIKEDLDMPSAELLKWRITKDRGVALFAAEHGGSFEVFNERPLRRAISEYCIQDVQLLPRLWQRYDAALKPDWRKKVEEATRDRIELSQSEGYNGTGRHMTLGPWS